MDCQIGGLGFDTCPYQIWPARSPSEGNGFITSIKAMTQRTDACYAGRWSPVRIPAGANFGGLGQAKDQQNFSRCAFLGPLASAPGAVITTLIGCTACTVQVRPQRARPSTPVKKLTTHKPPSTFFPLTMNLADFRIITLQTLSSILHCIRAAAPANAISPLTRLPPQPPLLIGEIGGVYITRGVARTCATEWCERLR